MVRVLLQQCSKPGVCSPPASVTFCIALGCTSCSAGTEVRSYFDCDSWWTSLAACRPKDWIQDVCLSVQMPPRSRSRVPVGTDGDSCDGCRSTPPTIGGARGFDYSSITNKNFRTASFRDSWSAGLEQCFDGPSWFVDVVSWILFKTENIFVSPSNLKTFELAPSWLFWLWEVFLRVYQILHYNYNQYFSGS